MQLVRALRNWWAYGAWTPCPHTKLTMKRLEAIHPSRLVEEYWTVCEDCRCVLSRVGKDGDMVRPS